MGKRVRMRFEEETEEQWYEGVISSYIITEKYSIYVPYDGWSEEASFDDDMEIISCFTHFTMPNTIMHQHSQTVIKMIICRYLW